MAIAPCSSLHMFSGLLKHQWLPLVLDCGKSVHLEKIHGPPLPLHLV